MSFSSGVFTINTSGQPVVTGTVISAPVFNAFTGDIATGLSTCLLKDGTQTVTANIPMSTYKFTGLGAGSASGDSVRFEQLGLILIAVATASTSATIDFTGLSSTYDEYVLTVTNFVPAANNSYPILRVSEDNGSTYKSGASDYGYISSYNTDISATPTGYGDSSESGIWINGGNGVSSTASKGGLCCEIRIFSPASTSANKLFYMSGCSVKTAGGEAFFNFTTSGRFVLDTNAINAVRILSSSGNITSGNFALYGVKKA